MYGRWSILSNAPFLTRLLNDLFRNPLFFHRISANFLLLQVPTNLEATGAIQPGDVILSVNGIPLPGPRSFEKDEALLTAPGMFPMRLRIHRPKQGAVMPDVGYVGESADGAAALSGGVWGKGMGAGLEGSLSRLKQVSCRD